MRTLKRFEGAFLIGLVATAVAAFADIRHASAQTYPSRPITMIVPFPAGGPSDSIGRIVAERLQVSLGQPIITENVAGASGSIGVSRVARSASDGYTFLFGNWATNVVNGAVLPLQYDVVRDFEPVALVVHSPMLIIGRNGIPARDLKQLVTWLKANPDKATEGAAGLASASHLASILFQKMTDTNIQLVPYRGVGLAMQDLMGGRIDLMFDLAANSLPQVRAGTIKAYAVLSKARFESAPDIPTVTEAGIPGPYVSSWQAIWLPKGTPKNVISKLNTAVMEALDDPAVRQRLVSLAQEIPPRPERTPEALSALQKAEIETWWPIIKAAGIKAE